MGLECQACGSQGWWCRGCGSPEKIAALITSGLSSAFANAVRNYQFGCCSLPRVPCWLCNRDGLTVPGEKDEDPSFWEAFTEAFTEHETRCEDEED